LIQKWRLQSSQSQVLQCVCVLAVAHACLLYQRVGWQSAATCTPVRWKCTWADRKLLMSPQEEQAYLMAVILSAVVLAGVLMRVASPYPWLLKPLHTCVVKRPHTTDEGALCSTSLQGGSISCRWLRCTIHKSWSLLYRRPCFLAWHAA
jgi:hypothetical protein